MSKARNAKASTKREVFDSMLYKSIAETRVEVSLKRELEKKIRIHLAVRKSSE